MAIDKAVKDSIIVAAITSAGPAGDDAALWEANVLRAARKITAVLADESNPFAKAIDEIDGASKFIAVVSLVKRETSSTRGVVYFQAPIRNNNEKWENWTPPLTYEQVAAIHAEQAAARAAGQRPADLPEGLEAIRTERTDTVDGLLMAKEATALIGHRVVVYKIQEPIKNGTQKVRVLRQVTDLGVFDAYVVPAKPVAEPAKELVNA
jgi:hypothetical protein